MDDIMCLASGNLVIDSSMIFPSLQSHSFADSDFGPYCIYSIDFFFADT